MKKLKIGIIGAGAISAAHLSSYQKNAAVEVYAICDVNEASAKARAEEFGIPKYFASHDDILNDESIDAVSIVTPTFTHKNLIIAALEKGKHVLCEKPPAMNDEEATMCEQAALKAGKVLMYGFVCRFTKEIIFLKEYIDSGKMGEIYYAEASRLQRCCNIGGWFVDKTKSGGGALIDATIHEIDAALYLMGYPKVKSVKGFATNINEHLPSQMKCAGKAWGSLDTNRYQRSVESLATGYVHFENGACLYIKASWVLNTLQEGKAVDLFGTKAGSHLDDDGVKLLTVEENNYFMESSPVLKDDVDCFEGEINHFVDCCQGKAECICTPRQGTQIMEIIRAIYESAETGKEVVF